MPHPPFTLTATIGAYAGQTITPFIFQEGATVVLKAKLSDDTLVDLSTTMGWKELDISFTDASTGIQTDAGTMTPSNVHHYLTKVSLSASTKINPPVNNYFVNNTKYYFNISTTGVNFGLAYIYKTPPVVTLTTGDISKLNNSLKFVLHTANPKDISAVTFTVFESNPNTLASETHAPTMYTKTLPLDWVGNPNINTTNGTVTLLFNGTDAQFYTGDDMTTEPAFTEDFYLDCSVAPQWNPYPLVGGSYSSNLLVTSQMFEVKWNDTQNAPIIDSLTSSETDLLLLAVSMPNVIENVPPITSYRVKLVSLADSAIYYTDIPYTVPASTTTDLSTMEDWYTNIGLTTVATAPSFDYNNRFDVTVYAVNGTAEKNVSSPSNTKSFFICKINSVTLSNSPPSVEAQIDFQNNNLLSNVSLTLAVTSGTVKTYTATVSPPTTNTLIVDFASVTWTPVLPSFKNGDTCVLTVKGITSGSSYDTNSVTSDSLTVKNIVVFTNLTTNILPLDIEATITIDDNSSTLLEYVRYSLSLTRSGSSYTYTARSTPAVPLTTSFEQSIKALTWTATGGAPAFFLQKNDVCTLTVFGTNGAITSNSLVSEALTMDNTANITGLSFDFGQSTYNPRVIVILDNPNDLTSVELELFVDNSDMYGPRTYTTSIPLANIESYAIGVDLSTIRWKYQSQVNLNLTTNSRIVKTNICTLTATVYNNLVTSTSRSTPPLTIYQPPLNKVTYNLSHLFTATSSGATIKVQFATGPTYDQDFKYEFTYNEGSSTTLTTASNVIKECNTKPPASLSIILPGGENLEEGTYTVFGRIEYPYLASFALNGGLPITTVTKAVSDWQMLGGSSILITGVNSPEHKSTFDIKDMVATYFKSIQGATTATFSSTRLNSQIITNGTYILRSEATFSVSGTDYGTLTFPYKNPGESTVEDDQAIAFGSGNQELPTNQDITVTVTTYAEDRTGLVTPASVTTILPSKLKLYPMTPQAYSFADLSNPTFTRLDSSNPNVNTQADALFTWTYPTSDVNNRLVSLTDTPYMDQLSDLTVLNNPINYNIDQTFFRTQTSADLTLTMVNASNRLNVTMTHDSGLDGDTPLPYDATLSTVIPFNITSTSLSRYTITFNAKVNNGTKYIKFCADGYPPTVFTLTETETKFTYYFTATTTTPITSTYELGPMTSTGGNTTMSTPLSSQVISLSDIQIQNITADSQFTITDIGGVTSASINSTIDGNELQLITNATNNSSNVTLSTSVGSLGASATSIPNTYTVGNSATDILRIEKGSMNAYSYVTFSLPTAIDFTYTKVLAMKIYSSTVQQIEIRLMDSTGNQQNSATSNYTQENTWQTLYFDFTGINTSYMWDRFRFSPKPGTIGNVITFLDTTLVQNAPLKYDQKLVSKAFSMVTGTYQFTFMAKASENRQIVWNIQNATTGDNGAETVVDLTTTYKTYTFVINGPGSNKAFEVGFGGPGTYTTSFRNFTLYKTPNSVVTPKTKNGSPLSTPDNTVTFSVDIGSPFRVRRSVTPSIYGVTCDPILFSESSPFIATVDPSATVSGNTISVFNGGSPLREVFLVNADNADNARDISSLLSSSDNYQNMDNYTSRFTTNYTAGVRNNILRTYTEPILRNYLITVSTDYARFNLLNGSPVNKLRELYIPYKATATNQSTVSLLKYYIEKTTTTPDLAIIGNNELGTIWISLAAVMAGGKGSSLRLIFNTNAYADKFVNALSAYSSDIEKPTQSLTGTVDILIKTTNPLSAVSSYFSNATFDEIGLPSLPTNVQLTSIVNQSVLNLLGRTTEVWSSALLPMFPNLSNTVFTLAKSWYVLNGVGGFILGAAKQTTPVQTIPLDTYLIVGKHFDYNTNGNVFTVS